MRTVGYHSRTNWRGDRHTILTVDHEDGSWEDLDSRSAGFASGEAVILGCVAWATTHWLVGIAAFVVHFAVSHGPWWKALAMVSAVAWGLAAAVGCVYAFDAGFWAVFAGFACGYVAWGAHGISRKYREAHADL